MSKVTNKDMISMIRAVQDGIYNTVVIGCEAVVDTAVDSGDVAAEARQEIDDLLREIVFNIAPHGDFAEDDLEELISIYDENGVVSK